MGSRLDECLYEQIDACVWVCPYACVTICCYIRFYSWISLFLNVCFSMFVSSYFIILCVNNPHIVSSRFSDKYWRLIIVMLAYMYTYVREWSFYLISRWLCSISRLVSFCWIANTKIYLEFHFDFIWMNSYN